MEKSPSGIKYVAPSRAGKTLIGGHFAPEVKRELKTLAAQQDSSIQALLDEAITDLLTKHGHAAK